MTTKTNATITEPLVAELEQEAATTRRFLERVPGDKLDWRPHEKSMTLGQLALHVATIPGGIAELLAQDGLEVSGVDFTPSGAESAEELVPTLERSVETARTQLQGWSDEFAAAPWTMTLHGATVSAIPRAGMARGLLFNHWYHHRGMLGVFLRLLDVPVPTAYGRTADEDPFAT